jgi:hypothetical protein
VDFNPLQIIIAGVIVGFQSIAGVVVDFNPLQIIIAAVVVEFQSIAD